MSLNDDVCAVRVFLNLVRFHLSPVNVVMALKCLFVCSPEECSLDLFASTRVARTRRPFSSFSITTFNQSAIILNHLCPPFPSPLSTNHTPHSHGR